MKKIICVMMLILVCVMAMSSCGNQDLGFGGFNFKTVHVSDASGNYKDFHIKSWKNDDTGIEINTHECGRMFLSEGTYIMFENDECPICHKEEK